MKTVYEKRATLQPRSRVAAACGVGLSQFVKAGANLSDADKAKLRKLNEEDSKLRPIS